MRVCLLSARFPPDLDGNGDYTYFLASALARLGCDVYVLTSVGEFSHGLYPLVPELRVTRLVKSWGIRGVLDIVRAVRGLDPDVLVVQYTPHAFHPRGMTLAVNLLPLLIRVTSRIRVMVNFHELYIPFDASLKHCLGALWQRAMAFLIAVTSNALTAISSEWPRRLRRIGVWQAIQVIPVGSNIPRAYVSPEELQAIRQKLGVTRNTLLIGCLGSAGPDRNIELLMAAIRQLQRQHTFKVVWLGKSGLREQLLTGAHEGARPNKGSCDIIWTGPLPHPEVSRTMAACDLFVLPFADGISTKRGSLAAALLHGLPVLTTRGERLDDMFVHGENVYLVPSGDERAFADGLLELAYCPELRTRLARGAKALHDARFGWEVIARQVARSAEKGSKG
jgi:glycosyltransferase involved in cell wall biosynthesis